MAIFFFHREKQTSAESQKLKQIQAELSKLDVLLTSDVALLRKTIEEASFVFMEAQ